jgi:dipeptidyl aminopeptidase/acylaminoacyl peptidase
VTMPGNLLASDPVFSSDSVLFTVMATDGYTIRRLRSGSVLDVPRMGGDWFHPTASEPTDTVWAEQASDQGSRVFRVPTGPGQTTTEMTPEAQDAQEPVVSRDGKALAFLRAINGRNSLWVQKVGAWIGGSGPGTAREIAGADYDVREASFLPDHRIIFSSKRSGRFALYLATQPGNIEELRRPACSARYPAVSPDGLRIAFSCEEWGSSQIHVMDLEGNRELQLSHGDCNSISPAWSADSRRLIYATDCGRGLGLTALAEVSISR